MTDRLRLFSSQQRGCSGRRAEINKVGSSVERMDKDVLFVVSSNIKSRVLRSRKNQGKNECRETISSPHPEIGAWISLVKDVVHFKKFAWVQEENEEMFKRQFHGGLANETNHITLKKSELKAAWDSSWEGPLLCPFLSQAPASVHSQRHGLEGPLDCISTAFSVLPNPTWYCSLWDSIDCSYLLWTMIEDFSLDRGWSKIPIPPTES